MHRDIKSLNVFMDKDMVAKVADFGMCTRQKQLAEGCGTIQWAAPEVLKNIFGQKVMYDNKCDVYSFGVLMWECFHLTCPYSDTGLDQVKDHKITRTRYHTRSASSCGSVTTGFGDGPDLNALTRSDRI